jgi:hypothetical protein
VDTIRVEADTAHAARAATVAGLACEAVLAHCDAGAARDVLGAFARRLAELDQLDGTNLADAVERALCPMGPA